jgi:hypothetical protein
MSIIKQLALAIYKAPNNFIFWLIRLCVASIYFVRRRLLWIAHAMIFLYAVNHIHFFESREEFKLIGREESSNQTKALLLILALMLFWVWKGSKAMLGKCEKRNESSQIFKINESHIVTPNISSALEIFPNNEPALQDTTSKIADFERRMDYKAKPLSEEQQDALDTKFHNFSRSKKLPE